MYSKTTIVGHLGKDPESFNSKSGNTVVKLSVATKDGFGDKEHTEWHRVVVFGKTAEACEKYLSKGSLVLVEGKNRTFSYEKDGETKYSTDVIADSVQFLSSNRTETKAKPSTKKNTGPITDEDIPF